LTVSGDAAARRSSSRRSFGIPIFIGGASPSGRRGHGPAPSGRPPVLAQ
jgi:hypothetical protein